MNVYQKVDVLRRIERSWERRYWAWAESSEECYREAPLEGETCLRCWGDGVIEVSTHDLPMLCSDCGGAGYVYGPLLDALARFDLAARLHRLYEDRRVRAEQVAEAYGEAVELVELEHIARDRELRS